MKSNVIDKIPARNAQDVDFTSGKWCDFQVPGKLINPDSKIYQILIFKKEILVAIPCGFGIKNDFHNVLLFKIMHFNPTNAD